MNIENLLNLRKLMEAHWESGGKDTKLNGKVCSFSMPQWAVDDECGTHACAYGTWLLSPYNNGQHTLVKETSTAWYYVGRVHDDGDITPVFSGFNAAAKDFGLTPDESHFLFDPVTYPAYPEGDISSDYVIYRIDELLEGRRIPDND